MNFDISLSQENPDGLDQFMSETFYKDHLKKTGKHRKKYYITIKKEDEIVAGASGGVFGDSLFISDLIVDETHQNNGLGREILDKIENHANENNCKNIWVDTYEYQAPEFYEKNNYVEKGRIENYRGNYARIFYSKDL